MQILFVTMALDIGGAETHVVELSRALAGMGHRVTVASAGGVFEAALANAGVDHVTLPLASKDPRCVFAAKRGLAALISDGGFDVVHGHARIPNFILSRVRKKIPFRFATTAHGVYSVNALWRRITDWGERSIAVSDDVREYLVREYKYPAEKIDVTVNGVDADRFTPSAPDAEALGELGLDPARRRVVFVGRLEADNDLAAKALCKAAPEIASAHPDADIVIVGGGGDLDAVKAAADAANERAGRRAVVLAGARAGVDRILAGASAFVGIASCALEAMACGIPAVIAGSFGYLGILGEENADAAREDNFTARGRLLPTADDISRDVCALLDMRDDDRRALGEYGRALVRREYSVERMARDYLDCWAEMGIK